MSHETFFFFFAKLTVKIAKIFPSIHCYAYSQLLLYGHSGPEFTLDLSPRSLAFPWLCQKLFLSICQFISLSVYLCLRLCVCLLSTCVCAYIWASASSVFPPSVAWASVALHEMNALFPPRFQMWCSVWMTAASRPTSLCSSPAATGWPPCSAALSWRATLRRWVVLDLWGESKWKNNKALICRWMQVLHRCGT